MTMDRDHQLFRLWTLLRQTYVIVQKNQERELAQYDLNMTSYITLFLIHYSTRPVTPTAIAAYLSQEGPTITYSLDKLEQRGLIQRSQSLDNRRGIWLNITDEGIRVLHAANRIAWQPLVEICDIESIDREFNTLFATLLEIRNRGAARLGAKIEALDFALDHLRRDPFLFGTEEGDDANGPGAAEA